MLVLNKYCKIYYRRHFAFTTSKPYKFKESNFLFASENMVFMVGYKSKLIYKLLIVYQKQNNEVSLICVRQ